MAWYIVVATILVGFGSGVLSGMFGVGGAVLTTPGIRVLGATPIEGVGSTVPAILPGAISGTIRYSRAGLVNWRVGLVCGGSGTVLAIGGAWVADLVNAHYLMITTAAMLGWSGVANFRAGRADEVVAPDPESETAVAEVVDPSPGTAGSVTPPAVAEPADEIAPRRLASSLELIVVGAVAGFLAGLLGVGGGVVMMPAFSNILKIPIKEAVASSLVAVAIFSVPALVTHAALGHVNWAFALLLTVGVIPGAQIGSKVTEASADHTVRIASGLFFIVLAVVYGGSEILALR